MKNLPALDPQFGAPAHDAFAIEINASDTNVLNLLVSPPGNRMEPKVIWTRQLNTIDDRNTVLDTVHVDALDLAFLGRVTMIFGNVELDKIIDGIISAATHARHEAAEEAAKTARNHQPPTPSAATRSSFSAKAAMTRIGG